MSLRTFAALISGTMLVVGLCMLLMPVSTGPVLNQVSCGSAIAPADTGDAGREIGAAITGSAFTPSPCPDLISDRRLLAWPVTLVGLVVLAGVVLVRRHSSEASSAK